MLVDTRFFVRESQGKILWNSRFRPHKTGDVDEDLLTIPEAAKRLTIGESTLRRYLRRRLLSYIVLPGNDQRIEPRELEEFKKSRTISRREK